MKHPRGIIKLFKEARKILNCVTPKRCPNCGVKPRYGYQYNTPSGSEFASVRCDCGLLNVTMPFGKP